MYIVIIIIAAVFALASAIIIPLAFMKKQPKERHNIPKPATIPPCPKKPVEEQLQSDDPEEVKEAIKQVVETVITENEHNLYSDDYVECNTKESHDIKVQQALEDIQRKREPHEEKVKVDDELKVIGRGSRIVQTDNDYEIEYWLKCIDLETDRHIEVRCTKDEYWSMGCPPGKYHSPFYWHWERKTVDD